jgi:hypothetical protein
VNSYFRDLYSFALVSTSQLVFHLSFLLSELIILVSNFFTRISSLLLLFSFFLSACDFLFVCAFVVFYHAILTLLLLNSSLAQFYLTIKNLIALFLCLLHHLYAVYTCNCCSSFFLYCFKKQNTLIPFLS